MAKKVAKKVTKKRQEIAFPCMSVSVTIVLLKDD